MNLWCYNFTFIRSFNFLLFVWFEIICSIIFDQFSVDIFIFYRVNILITRHRFCGSLTIIWTILSRNILDILDRALNIFRSYGLRGFRSGLTFLREYLSIIRLRLLIWSRSNGFSVKTLTSGGTGQLSRKPVTWVKSRSNCPSRHWLIQFRLRLSLWGLHLLIDLVLQSIYEFLHQSRTWLEFVALLKIFKCLTLLAHHLPGLSPYHIGLHDIDVFIFS